MRHITGVIYKMLDLKGLFYGRKPIIKRLLSFGFKKKGDGYDYSREIADGQFIMTVTMRGSTVSAVVWDRQAESPYCLHLVEGAEGAFVGEVRSSYEACITEISDKCFSAAEVFRERTAQQVIAYAKKTYGTPPEFLWKDENAVMRRRDNRKWYVAFLQPERKKLGLEGEGRIEIADVLAPADEISKLIDGINYLPAYHMNKRYWLTIPLDGRVPAEVVCAFLDVSYNLAKKK